MIGFLPSYYCKEKKGERHQLLGSHSDQFGLAIAWAKSLTSHGIPERWLLIEELLQITISILYWKPVIIQEP